jgi:FkbM family methyltransferase
MTFVDIGANQGEYSLFAAKRLTNGLVLAFEPVDHFFQQLNENVSLNHFNNIRTFPFGLSNVSSQSPIYMGDQGAGENEGLASIYQSSIRKRFIQSINLKVLDDLEPSLGLVRIDFIKIDVEGAELMVLKGSLKTIVKYKPWIMIEISEDTYRSAGYSVNDVRDFFDSIDYSLYSIGRAGQLTKTNEIPSYCDVIFRPN